MSYGPFADAVSGEWRAWRQAVDLDEYDARWDRQAASGGDVHGEADLLESLGPVSVLDAGCGMGRVAIELARRGIDTVGIDLDDDLLARARRRAPELAWVHDDLATVQLARRFHVVAMPGNVMNFCRPVDRRMIMHNMAQHLQPGGLLVAGFGVERGPGALALGEYDQLAADCELSLVDRFATWDKQPYAGGDYAVSVHRRGDRYNVHDMVFEARRTIRRVTPVELAARLGRETPPIVVDTRAHVDRERFGIVPGSVHVPRTVVEWQLDPGNGFHHPRVRSLDDPLVVVCNGGYSSSISAAHLVRIGYTDVADLIGGMAAWRRAGLATVPPDHSHLGY